MKFIFNPLNKLEDKFSNDNLRIEDSNGDINVSDMPEVKAMPTYPNDGSIAIIDDMVVVKMGE